MLDPIEKKMRESEIRKDRSMYDENGDYKANMIAWMENAAEHSRWSDSHWFRYLRKVIFDDRTNLNEMKCKYFYNLLF